MPDTLCPHCRGTGLENDYCLCPHCKGLGRASQPTRAPKPPERVKDTSAPISSSRPSDHRKSASNGKEESAAKWLTPLALIFFLNVAYWFWGAPLLGQSTLQTWLPIAAVLLIAVLVLVARAIDEDFLLIAAAVAGCVLLPTSAVVAPAGTLFLFASSTIVISVSDGDGAFTERLKEGARLALVAFVGAYIVGFIGMKIITAHGGAEEETCYDMTGWHSC